MEKHLRDYQVEAIEVGLAILNNKSKKNGLLVEPTAAGKSHIVAEIANRFDKPLLCIQPSKELLEQNYEKLLLTGSTATIYSASLKKKELSHLTFGTIGSLISAVEEIKKMGIKHIILDEAHLMSKRGTQIRKLIKQVGITHVLGLTATAVYLDSGFEGAQINMITDTWGSLFKSINHLTQIKHLVDNNYWSKLSYKIINQDESKLVVNKSGSDYNLDSLSAFFKQNDLEKQTVVEVMHLVAEGRKSILVFVPNIEEAISLSKKISISRVLHSGTPAAERDEIVNGFKSLEIPVVINCSILSTGFDHPQLDAIVLTRTLMSITLYYQMLGRGVRTHADKKDCKIVDLSNSYNRFGKIEDLNYEFIEGYGWGLYQDNSLLTGVPLKSVVRPTKQSIMKSLTPKEKQDDIIFHFGKYRGAPVEKIFYKDKNYLHWLVDNEDFEWNGLRGQVLNDKIREILLLPKINWQNGNIKK